MTFLSQVEYAKHRGVSKGRISQLKDELKKAGCITQGGKIRVEKADEYLEGRLNPAKARNQKPTTELNESREQTPGMDSDQEIEIPEVTCDFDGLPKIPRGITESDARTIKLLIEAKERDFNLKKKLGTLIEADECRETCFNRGRALRDAILNVPARISARLANMSDQFEVEQYLTTELKTALRSEISA